MGQLSFNSATGGQYEDVVFAEDQAPGAGAGAVTIGAGATGSPADAGAS
jgi:hypothetical protein